MSRETSSDGSHDENPCQNTKLYLHVCRNTRSLCSTQGNKHCSILSGCLRCTICTARASSMHCQGFQHALPEFPACTVRIFRTHSSGEKWCDRPCGTQGGTHTPAVINVVPVCVTYAVSYVLHLQTDFAFRQACLYMIASPATKTVSQCMLSDTEITFTHTLTSRLVVCTNLGCKLPHCSKWTASCLQQQDSVHETHSAHLVNCMEKVKSALVPACHTPYIIVSTLPATAIMPATIQAKGCLMRAS